MTRLRFSGHETFAVRTFWPKKGYDFIINGGKFSNPDAGIKLGVGKNMVSSISYWMKALNLYDELKEQQTEFADLLFGDNGYDMFLEDIGSIWLLHYQLVKSNYASIYNLVFNSFRKERTIFTKRQLNNYIKRQFTDLNNLSYNSKTIDKDINVFLRSYNAPDYKSITKDFEEEIGGLFLELELMTSNKDVDLNEERVNWYNISSKERNSLPPEIVLFVILDCFENTANISFRRLEIENNSPGLIFALSKEGLYKVIKEIELITDSVIVSESAGNISLVISEGLDKWEILKKYYEE